MATKKGLGKGLDSLITNKVAVNTTTPETQTVKKNPNDPDARIVDINKVEPNREQPRKNFNEDELIELSESIKIHGMFQPITVQDRGTYFEIVAGERRWRAAKMAGLKEVPIIVGNYTEKEIVEISIIENLQRVDLNPIEKALAYKKLTVEFDMTQDAVAERLSQSRTAVTNTMRLLNLDERVQQLLVEDTIKEGPARALLAIKDKDKQYEAAMSIVDLKLNTREVEKLVKNINSEKKPEETKGKKIDPQLIAVYQSLEEDMKRVIGTKVSINPKDENHGKLEIEYYSSDELDRIIDLLRTVQK